MVGVFLGVQAAAVIMLGFVVAVGLPIAVLVLSILWPEPGAEASEERENVRKS
ncbi:hypothetical protein [Nocardia carnea]|uniref:hypothetical protein n=1 Tax=Nocardia carnea TaxID=37328 RepID=UPI0024585FED|nr:hypothetical protein [Nocardia carnea]